MFLEALGAGVAMRLAEGFIGEPLDLGAAAGDQDVQAGEVVGVGIGELSSEAARGSPVNLSRYSNAFVFRVVCFAAFQES